MDRSDVLPSPERIAVFVDYHNVENSLRRAGARVDTLDLVEYLIGKRQLIECFFYIATHPKSEQCSEDDAKLRGLQMSGYLVRTKHGQRMVDGQLKCDFDVEIALDAYEFCRMSHPDTVVLVTGDGHFAPLAQRVRLQGTRVEVASMPDSISSDLRAWANGFVDLCELAADVDHMPLPEVTPEGAVKAEQSHA